MALRISAPTNTTPSHIPHNIHPSKRFLHTTPLTCTLQDLRVTHQHRHHRLPLTRLHTTSPHHTNNNAPRTYSPRLLSTSLPTPTTFIIPLCKILTTLVSLTPKVKETCTLTIIGRTNHHPTPHTCMEPLMAVVVMMMVVVHLEGNHRCITMGRQITAASH